MALTRGVPIFGSTIILATDLVIFTNIGIGTELPDDLFVAGLSTG